MRENAQHHLLLALLALARAAGSGDSSMANQFTAKSNQATEGRNEPVPIMKEAANLRRPQFYSGPKRADYDAANAHIATTLTAVRAAASPTACHFGL
jgi:hypothetical protein